MQVAELLVGVPAPILYWEQGHEWLFGDPVRFQVGFLGNGHPFALAHAKMRSLEVGEVSPASQALHLQVNCSMPFVHFRPFRPLNAWSTMASYFQSYDALEHALKV